MHDKNISSLPFESGDESEMKLWDALADLPAGEPSSEMRRRFYRRLEQAGKTGFSERFGRWLGLRGHSGWLTATACLLLGFAVAQLPGERPASEPDRLVALEQNVALLNRELILGRLQDEAAATRLTGVIEASDLAGGDLEIVQALLRTATQDRALSVRSAAIDALAPQLKSDNVGSELMKLLEQAESPIVQLALVDLFLRHGSTGQVAQLLRLAESGQLHSDLIPHVKNSARSESI